MVETPKYRLDTQRIRKYGFHINWPKRDTQWRVRGTDDVWRDTYVSWNVLDSTVSNCDRIISV
jgi:hypothetical protein